MEWGPRAGRWLPLVALLPLLARRDPPDVFRVLQVFSVPLAILAVASVLLPTLAEAPSADAIRARLGRAVSSALAGARGPVVVFLVTLAAVSLVRAQFISARSDDPRREHLLTGDEPSYLLLTHSLVFDGDFNLFNNREQNDQRYFYRRPLLAPGQFGFDFYNRISGGRLAGREAEWVGREYFVNRPGLPILLAPAYWLGFHAGLRIRFAVLVWLNLLAAALATVMFVLARAVSGAPAASAAAALLLALTPPLLYYSCQIYPEVPAGLFLAGAVLGLARLGGAGGALVTGLLIAYLPWFHERFLGVALVLTAAGLFRSPVRRRFAWLALPVVVSCVLLGIYYQGFYGIPIPLHVGTDKPLAPTAIPGGLLALLTDRDRGILLLNPMLLLAALGFAPVWRHDRWLAGTLTAALVADLLPIAAYPDWHGGFCPPLRYVAAAVPLLVIPLGALLGGGGGPVVRWSLGVLAAWSVWTGFAMVSQPGVMWWKYGAPFSPQILHAAHPFFPGYFHPAPGATLRSALWLAFLASGPALDWALRRRGVAVTSGLAFRWGPVLFAGGVLIISLASAVARPG